MTNFRTSNPPAQNDSQKKPRWPIVATIFGGTLALGWMGVMTAALLKPDQSTEVLMELLLEERGLNMSLVQQAQLSAPSTTARPALSAADREALLDDLVTRSNQSDFMVAPTPVAAGESQQTSALLAAAVQSQGTNTTAIQQLAGTDPCIATLSNLVQNARIPFESAAIQPTSTDLEIAREIAIAASNCPTVMVAVEGHTDPSGNEVDNLLISWQRAEETINMLEAEGFDVARFEPLGFGSRHLVSQGNDVTAAASNRRVQFHLAPMPNQ